MSKFFVQLLLSLAVGVSAALGFSPNIKSEVREALQKTDVSLHEMVKTAVENASDVASHVSAVLSIQVNSSTESDAETDVSVDGNVTTIIGNLFPDFWVNGSATTETQTTTEKDSPGLSIERKDSLNSTLNFGGEPEE